MNEQLDNQNDDWLWRAYDDKNPRLFIQVPNPIMREIVTGKYSRTETRIMLYMCRMSFGFKGREQTGYLHSSGISAETGISIKHVYVSMKKLISSKKLFQGKQKGNTYKYAVNLLMYGATMKHYKIVNSDYLLEENEIEFCEYKNENRTDVSGENLWIVYNPAGLASQNSGI